MSSYPWGPHGPQSGPNEVTPNPTPAYVPPPAPAQSWSPAPAPYGGGYAQPSDQNAGLAGYGGQGPSKKSYLVAILLALFFGPLGLFYASRKGALALLVAVVAVPVGLAFTGQIPGFQQHPFQILDHDGIMSHYWTYASVLSVLWSIVAVSSRNAAIKAGS